MSHYYEDFAAGSVFESRGRTVTEADIVNFAGLSGDFVELHTNEEYARQSPFGRRIAHGALIFSISTGLMTQMNLINETVLAFYGMDKLRFTAPVFIGDTVRVVKSVVEMRERRGARRGDLRDTSTESEERSCDCLYGQVATEAPTMRPLEGTVVLDLTRLLPGAAAACSWRISARRSSRWKSPDLGITRGPFRPTSTARERCSRSSIAGRRASRWT